MKSLFVAYVAAAVCMMVVDSVWLTLAAANFYRPHLGPLLADQFRLGPAITFYLLYLAGVVFFAVRPALVTGRWQTAVLHGLVLGLVAYGTYDLTNQATLKTWPVIVTVVDLFWGSFLTALTATSGYFGAQVFRDW